MINLAETAAKVDPIVDGILMSPAMVPHCRNAFNYKGAPFGCSAAELGTVYYISGNIRIRSLSAFSPAEALRLGADVALISLTLETGSEANDAAMSKCSAIFARLQRLGYAGDRRVLSSRSGQPYSGRLHAKVYTCARIIAELGADLIKTFYTCKFKVTRSCPVPVLGLGAARCPTQLEALQLAADEVRDGARWCVFGRNAVQVRDPAAFQARCAMLSNAMSNRLLLCGNTS